MAGAAPCSRISPTAGPSLVGPGEAPINRTDPRSASVAVVAVGHALEAPYRATRIRAEAFDQRLGTLDRGKPFLHVPQPEEIFLVGSLPRACSADLSSLCNVRVLLCKVRTWANPQLPREPLPRIPPAPTLPFGFALPPLQVVCLLGKQFQIVVGGP